MKPLVDKIKEYFNITHHNCPKEKINILIINRNRIQNRKILNSDKLQNMLQQRTKQNVKTLFLENLPLRQQMQEVECTDIMIGVHGAGLTWYTSLKIQLSFFYTKSKY